MNKNNTVFIISILFITLTLLQILTSIILISSYTNTTNIKFYNSILLLTLTFILNILFHSYISQDIVKDKINQKFIN